MKWQFRNGEPYDGPTITLPDGRVLSGKTFTADSQRLIPRENENGSERSGELHEASSEETPVQPRKSRGKGRKTESVVRKKSAKASPSV